MLLNENIDRLIASFLNTSKVDIQGSNSYLNNELIYQTIIGAVDEEVSQVDLEKQKNFVNYISGMFEFMKGYSPADGYMSTEPFCRAYSADSDISKLAHRLYFNYTDERIEFVDLVIRKLKSKGLPFMLKWDKSAVRRDNVVMYVEDDKLTDTAQALQEIIENYPEFATPRELPMSAVNGGWFGYGVEDQKQSHISYNQRITRCVIRAMTRAFSKFREGFELGALSDFAELLFDNCKNQKIEKGAKFNEVHEDRKELLPLFEQNAMRLALDIIGTGEGSCGFDTTPDGRDAVAEDLPIKTIQSKNGRAIDITPSAVMNTMLSLIKQDESSFDLPQDKHAEFVETIKEELLIELQRENIPVELPAPLLELSTYGKSKMDNVLNRD